MITFTKKEDIINKITNDAGVTHGVAKLALKSVLESITNAIKTGDRVTLSKFGSFVPTYRKEKKVVHPKTKKSIVIPEKLTVKFKPGKQFLEKINSSVMSSL